MKEVQLVSLSPGIYLQKRKEYGLYPFYFHPYCLWGVIRRPGGVKKGPPPGHPPPTTTPPLLCPLPACENAAGWDGDDGECRSEGKSRRMQRYAGRSLWDKWDCPRLQCCVPFLGICPPAGCNFQTGKSDDCITAAFLSEQKVHFGSV